MLILTLIFGSKKLHASRPSFGVIFVWVAILATCACSSSSGDDSSLDGGAAHDAVADVRWLDKAARALRFGQGLSPDDPLRKYVNRPKSEAVDVLMKDPLFFPTMMDFYSFYFGFKSNDGISKTSSRSRIAFDPKTRILSIANQCDPSEKCVDYKSYHLNRQLFNHVATITGAVQVIEGRSISDLYRPIQPPYIALSAMTDLASQLIFSSIPQSEIAKTKDFKVNIDTVHKKTKHTLEKLARVLSQELAQENRSVVSGLCKKVNATISEQEGVIYALGALIDLAPICPLDSDIPIAQARKMREQTTRAIKVLPDLFKFIEDFLTHKLKLMHGTYFEAPPAVRHVLKRDLYGSTFWENHPNSSTNFNRKRAAYVLKTFFCDDLTPVNLEITKDPGDNRHASDPSCMACHYKLDPLAGFFRHHGASGLKFDADGDFYFDDLKKINGVERQNYLESWNFPDQKGPNGGLNVGLVRSSTDPSKNSYGSTLEDLGRLITKDPRTFMCKTQRLADYFIGAGLTYDRLWLEQIAGQIKSAPETSNGTAIKTVIKSLLLSKSFTIGDPVDGVCYDQALGQRGRGSMDCLVASTIDKYCVKCHAKDSSNGQLDLSQWSEASGFKHTSERGKAYAPKESYQIILKRLGPSKDGPIMPLNSPMPDPERRTLLNWFEEKLKVTK